jgi:uncharacterized protein
MKNDYSTMLVSNSSPLIHLSRLGKMGYMTQAFASMTIPKAVRFETIDRGKSEGYSDTAMLERLETEGWLKTVKLSNLKSIKIAESLKKEIGKGEAEAIALALEKKERLLIDDQKGRLVAVVYGVETITTLGIMFELLAKGILNKGDYRRNVKNYGSQGWISAEVMQEFLEQGEAIE